MVEPISALARLFRRKRGSSRERRDGTVFLFVRGSYIGQGRILDESLGGARVECPPGFVTDKGQLLCPITGRAHDFDVAWTEGRQLGLRFTRTINIRGFVGPEWDQVKLFWTRLEVGNLRSPPRAAAR